MSGVKKERRRRHRAFHDHEALWSCPVAGGVAGGVATGAAPNIYNCFGGRGLRLKSPPESALD